MRSSINAICRPSLSSGARRYPLADRGEAGRHQLWGHEFATNRGDVQRLLTRLRGHWGIENKVHCRRDVTFHADHTRVRRKRASQGMAALNNFILSVLAWLGYDSIPEARRHFAAHLDQVLAVIGRAPT